MSTYTYLFTDLLTGQVLADLPCYGVHLETKLNGIGNTTFSIKLGTEYDVNDIVNSTIPGRTCMYADRDGTLVWGGVVWSRTYQTNGNSFEYTAQTFESLADKRKWTGPGDSGGPTKTYQNAEQLQILLDMWNYMQSVAGTNYGIIVPSLAGIGGASGILRNLVLNSWELRTIGDITRSLSQLANGFDWNIAVQYDGTGKPIKQLRVGYPGLGIPAQKSGTLFDQPGNIKNLWWPESAADAGTWDWAIGAGEGTSQLLALAQNANLLNAGWPVLERDDSYKDINDPAMLQAQAAVDLGLYQPPIVSPSADIDPSFPDPALGSYQCGDYVRVVVEGTKPDPLTGRVTNERGDPRWPQGLDTFLRITGMTIDPPEGETNENVHCDFMQVVN